MAYKVFWTARRLRELRTKARKLDLPQLAKHFGKSEDSCSQALTYANAMIYMRIGKTKEIVHDQLVYVVKIKAAHASYAHSAYWNVGYGTDAELSSE